jgi:isopenicillin-N epimerase
MTALRDEFLLDPDVVFLNHGSFGACPRPVFERYQAWQRELERRPVEFLARRLPGLLDDVRARLAEYLGARPDDLVLVRNATSGVNAVARSLRLAPGDEVLATDHEYGACDLLWRHVCARAGARYVRARLPLPVDSADAVVDAVLASVTERTRALFVSHVTSPTAIVLPVAELARAARALGILTVVDGAHAPGQLPVDLADLGVDAYAGTCHKWLCAPKGAGFLWVRSELQDEVDAVVIGWGYEDETTFAARHMEAGTQDPAAYLAVPAAIEWQREHGWDGVRDRCHELALAARARLAELTGLEPLTAASRERFAQVVAAPLPDCDAEGLQRRLFDEDAIEVLVRPWNGLPLVRVSFQGYNDETDLERLLGGLRRAL